MCLYFSWGQRDAFSCMDNAFPGGSDALDLGAECVEIKCKSAKVLFVVAAERSGLDDAPAERARRLCRQEHLREGLTFEQAAHLTLQGRLPVEESMSDLLFTGAVSFEFPTNWEWRVTTERTGKMLIKRIEHT